MPGTGGSVGNRHTGPHPHGREDKGRQGCARTSQVRVMERDRMGQSGQGGLLRVGDT